MVLYLATMNHPSHVALIAISDGAPPNKPNPVNALGAPVRKYLQTSLNAAIDDESIRAIILVGRRDGKGVFSAGADIKEFSGRSGGNATASDPNGIPTLNDLAHLMEHSPKPIVAALTGTCLGGGTELSLAAQYRVADNTLRYGLPEVKIGLIPGAGGTQRLPRLCGVRHALDVIVKGRIDCSAQEGLHAGFLDAIASNNESVLECAMRCADQASNLSKLALDSRRLCYRSVPRDSEGLSNEEMCNIALNSVPPVEKGGESVNSSISSIRASFEIPSFEDGMDFEKTLFNDLLFHSVQGRAYRHIFFAERATSSSNSIRKKEQVTKLDNGQGSIGVIGAGTMGRGIAVSFLRAGFGPVVLVDVSDKGLKDGVQNVISILEGEAKKGRIMQSKLSQMLSRLEYSTSLSGLAHCDIIVEAVYENLGIKRDIFSQINTISKKMDALLLSNTSTLDVDAIASSLSPQRRPFCAGMHFFSPAHVMKLVEVVRGAATSSETLDTICTVTKLMKKVPVVVGNCDGFVGNRMLNPYTTESMLLLAEFGGGESGLGVADVDRCMSDNFGMAVGPFQMSDIAGNDIGYNIRREKGLIRDPKTGQVGQNRTDDMRYTELGDEMVGLGRLGQKTQKGWYDYDVKIGKGRKPLHSSEMQELINKYSLNSPNRCRKISQEEIVERILFPLVNEGFKILEEGIAKDPADIDIIYLYGYGFPAWKGGPMFWADTVGLDVILTKLEELHRLYPGSGYFRPSDLMRKCVSKGLGVQEYYRVKDTNLDFSGVKSRL